MVVPQIGDDSKQERQFDDIKPFKCQQSSSFMSQKPPLTTNNTEKLSNTIKDTVDKLTPALQGVAALLLLSSGGMKNGSSSPESQISSLASSSEYYCSNDWF